MSGSAYVKYQVRGVHVSAVCPLKCLNYYKATIACLLMQVLGQNRVAVPTHLYKVVLAERGGEGKQALGVFIVPNKPIKNVDLTKFQVSLEELETHVGCTFHSELKRDQVCETTVVLYVYIHSLKALQYHALEQRCSLTSIYVQTFVM